MGSSGLVGYTGFLVLTSFLGFTECGDSVAEAERGRDGLL